MNMFSQLFAKGKSWNEKVSQPPRRMTNVTVEVMDSQIINQDIKTFLEKKIQDEYQSSHKVVALKIDCCLLDSLELTLGKLYSYDQHDFINRTHGKDNKAHSSANTNHYNAMNILLEENIENIFLINSKVILMDTSLNRYCNLVSLDLSNNNIYTIGNGVQLPSLAHLNLSGNNLQTLNGLQSLLSLKTLHAAKNQLYTLDESVYALVPLAQCLRALDIRRNLVCNQVRYVDEVIAVLPRLQYLDGNSLSLTSGGYEKLMITNNSIKSKPHQRYSTPIPYDISSEIETAGEDSRRLIPLLPLEKSSINSKIHHEDVELEVVDINDYEINARIIRAVRNRDRILFMRNRGRNERLLNRNNHSAGRLHTDGARRPAHDGNQSFTTATTNVSFNELSPSDLLRARRSDSGRSQPNQSSSGSQAHSHIRSHGYADNTSSHDYTQSQPENVTETKNISNILSLSEFHSSGSIDDTSVSSLKTPSTYATYTTRDADSSKYPRSSSDRLDSTSPALAHDGRGRHDHFSRSNVWSSRYSLPFKATDNYVASTSRDDANSLAHSTVNTRSTSQSSHRVNGTFSQAARSFPPSYYPIDYDLAIKIERDERERPFNTDVSRSRENTSDRNITSKMGANKFRNIDSSVLEETISSARRKEEILSSTPRRADRGNSSLGRYTAVSRSASRHEVRERANRYVSREGRSTSAPRPTSRSSLTRSKNLPTSNAQFFQSSKELSSLDYGLHAEGVGTNEVSSDSIGIVNFIQDTILETEQRVANEEQHLNNYLLWLDRQNSGGTETKILAVCTDTGFAYSNANRAMELQSHSVESKPTNLRTSVESNSAMDLSDSFTGEEDIFAIANRAIKLNCYEQRFCSPNPVTFSVHPKDDTKSNAGGDSNAATEVDVSLLAAKLASSTTIDEMLNIFDISTLPSTQIPILVKCSDINQSFRSNTSANCSNDSNSMTSPSRSVSFHPLRIRSEQTQDDFSLHENRNGYQLSREYGTGTSTGEFNLDVTDQQNAKPSNRSAVRFEDHKHAESKSFRGMPLIIDQGHDKSLVDAVAINKFTDSVGVVDSESPYEKMKEFYRDFEVSGTSAGNNFDSSAMKIEKHEVWNSDFPLHSSVLSNTFQNRYQSDNFDMFHSPNRSLASHLGYPTDSPDADESKRKNRSNSNKSDDEIRHLTLAQPSIDRSYTASKHCANSNSSTVTDSNSQLQNQNNSSYQDMSPFMSTQKDRITSQTPTSSLRRNISPTAKLSGRNLPDSSKRAGSSASGAVSRRIEEINNMSQVKTKIPLPVSQMPVSVPFALSPSSISMTPIHPRELSMRPEFKGDNFSYGISSPDTASNLSYNRSGFR